MSDKIRPSHGAIALVVLSLAGGAACSSGNSKSSSTTSTVVNSSTSSSTSTSSSSAPATVSSSSSSSAPPSSSTTAASPSDPEQVAKAFFAAWVKGDASAMAADAESGAVVTAAKSAAASGTSGYVFSNCQGAAGSTYCTFVHPGSRLVVRVGNQSMKVSEVTHAALDAQGVAQEFANAWESSNSDAMKVLGSVAAANQATALEADAPNASGVTNCSGAAGSTYCTISSGAHRLTIRVDNPSLTVIEFRLAS